MALPLHGEDLTPQDQFKLGMKHVSSTGANKNIALGLSLLDQAAKTLPEANVRLGSLYQYGIGVERDPVKAIKYYEQAIALGDVDSKVKLADVQAGVHRENPNPDFAKARQSYEEAVADGVANAYLGLGILYFQGKGVEIDYATAEKLFLEALERGSFGANGWLMMIYRDGKGHPRDLQKAFNYCLQAAELGQRDSCGVVGWIYLRGQWMEEAFSQPLAVQKDLDKAIAFLIKGALKDDGFSLMALGQCYAKGWGVPQMPLKAAYWFQKAANLGYPPLPEDMHRLEACGLFTKDELANIFKEHPINVNAKYIP